MLPGRRCYVGLVELVHQFDLPPVLVKGVGLLRRHVDVRHVDDRAELRLERLEFSRSDLFFRKSLF